MVLQIEGPLVAPLTDGGHHRPEVPTLVGQAVLVAQRTFGVRHLRQQTIGDEVVETAGEDVASDAQALLEVVEAAGAEARLTHDQQRPPVAERVDRLVLRHQELKRTSQLMEQQLQAVTAERDSLKSRLAAARARIDALLARLPAEGTESRP